MWKLFATWIAVCLVVPAASAQSASSADESETVKALMQEVRDLKARVAALEARQGQEVKPQEAQPGPTPQNPIEAQAPTADNSPFAVSPAIKLQGFGAVSYKATDARPLETALLGFRNGVASSAAVGDVDLFLTSVLTTKTSVLSEIVFSENSNQTFETDVERLLLKYDFNDYLKLSFGRYHTATSYYNSVFHHGQWLQTTADRPLVVEFSDHGGLLPSQAIGASITGIIPSGALGLSYIFEYGSSDTVRPDITNPTDPAVDENNGNAVTAGLAAKPDWAPGLDIGGSFYHDRINPNGGPFHIGQGIYSVHAVYETPRFEFLNEAFLIQHDVQETGVTFNTPAFYSLISEKFAERWRPYFRYQYVNASGRSPVFEDINLRHGPSGGLRYDFNDYFALKIQYDRTFRRQLPSINDLFLQMAFRF